MFASGKKDIDPQSSFNSDNGRRENREVLCAESYISEALTVGTDGDTNTQSLGFSRHYVVITQ